MQSAAPGPRWRSPARTTKDGPNPTSTRSAAWLRRRAEAHPTEAELLREIYRGLAQMRAQGTTCGYPLVTRIADLLCGFLRSVKETDQRHFALCDVHIDAIQSVLSEKIHDEEGPLARALLADLGRAEARLSS